MKYRCTDCGNVLIGEQYADPDVHCGVCGHTGPRKKARKSVPRPRSGMRGKDGAIGLKLITARIRPDQHEKFLELGGSLWLRKKIDES